MRSGVSRSRRHTQEGECAKSFLQPRAAGFPCRDAPDIRCTDDRGDTHQRPWQRAHAGWAQLLGYQLEALLTLLAGSATHTPLAMPNGATPVSNREREGAYAERIEKEVGAWMDGDKRRDPFAPTLAALVGGGPEAAAPTGAAARSSQLSCCMHMVLPNTARRTAERRGTSLGSSHRDFADRVFLGMARHP